MASSEISLEAVASASQIPPAEWDACANPGTGQRSINGHDKSASSGFAGESRCGLAFPYNPFVTHVFFSALEKSDSACPRTGWGPRHLIAKLGETIAGIVPC